MSIIETVSEADVTGLAAELYAEDVDDLKLHPAFREAWTAAPELKAFVLTRG